MVLLSAPGADVVGIAKVAFTSENRCCDRGRGPDFIIGACGFSDHLRCSQWPGFRRLIGRARDDRDANANRVHCHHPAGESPGRDARAGDHLAFVLPGWSLAAVGAAVALILVTGQVITPVWFEPSRCRWPGGHTRSRLRHRPRAGPPPRLVAPPPRNPSLAP